MRHPWRGLTAGCKVLTALVALVVAAPAAAQNYGFVNDLVQKRANGALALMSFSVIPDLTSSFLSINQGDADKSKVYMTQLAGGDTISKKVPIYLEGGIAYMRYDPQFVASNGTNTRTIPAKWNNLALTGGVGWDFPIVENLVFRPIFNFALGEIASDLAAGSKLLSWKTDGAVRFLDGGTMEAYGLGGSVMLDYELKRPEYEIDLEWRYTDIRLKTFGSSDIKGVADAKATSLYARWRAPTGLTMFQRPLRYVLEAAHTSYLGDQRGVLGFDAMSSIGAGIEFDSSAYDMIITRTRLVYRVAFGDNVRGYALGLAVSF